MMKKRDLKADSEQIQNFRSKWRQSTSLEEAWDIGVAWEYFCREKAELWLDQALVEKERADKAETLVRELVELVRIMHVTVITLLGCEDVSPEVVEKAKEALGDE